MEAKILLTTVSDVSNFVRSMTGCKAKAKLISGRNVVDASSLMGIFSLNLSNPITFKVSEDVSEDTLAQCKELIKPYAVA